MDSARAFGSYGLSEGSKYRDVARVYDMGLAHNNTWSLFFKLTKKYLHNLDHMTLDHVVVIRNNGKYQTNN
jgi:hypothetical protein